MINIISRSIVSTHTRGPRKVVANLLKGLDELGYPYVVNAALNATDTIWIHDDKAALAAALELPSKPTIIAGPNIYTQPNAVPTEAIERGILFIHPALWVQAFWDAFSTTKINSTIWPVGIDTKEFTPNTTNKKDLILIYNKQRSTEDIKLVCEALIARGEQFAVLTYGKYSEVEYRDLLEKTKAVVWVGRSESQGIGLLEALAMNVPVLLWDVTKLGDFVGAEQSEFSLGQLQFTPVTAAPYFDEHCGTRFTASVDLEPQLTYFLTSLTTFNPRSYVEKELSLAKQAAAFINILKVNFNKTDNELKSPELHSRHKWRNGTIYFKCLTRLKDAVRKVIR